MIEIDLFVMTFTILYLIIFGITAVIYQVMYKSKRIRLSFIGIFEAYLLMVFKVVILPIRIVTNPVLKNEVGSRFSIDSCVQLIPFHSIRGFLQENILIYMQILGNILLLLPLAMFFFYLFKRNSAKRVLLCSFLASLAIESVQLGLCLLAQFPVRVFDVDDLILNFVGACIGYGCCMVIKRIPKLNEKIVNTYVIR